MKEFFRKFGGVFCAIMAIGMPLSFLQMRSMGVGVGMLGPILAFLFFGIWAWVLLFPEKKDQNPNAQDEPTSSAEGKVSFGISFLVYLVDTIIVIATYMLPPILAILFNNGTPKQNSSIWGLVGFVLAIAVGILLPGPKKYMRMRNKKGEGDE